VQRCNRIVADFASGELSSLGNTQRRKYSLYKNLGLAAASAFVCWFVCGLPQSANAGDILTVADIQSTLKSPQQLISTDQPPQQFTNDPILAALNTFVQQIAPEEPRPSNIDSTLISGRQLDDQAFATLQAFARRLGTTQLESNKNLTKLAQADNALDALREFLQKNTAPQPSPSINGTPKAGPVSGGPKSSSAPIEATFVGMKVCLTCHTSQAESFGQTLMGRIGKTQKGKFDCENCHGPGSAHVKAGGGRGVGGIISFRPEDQSRTAEQNNGVCLTCHEKGDRTYWNGSTHESRGLMCTNCHTIMKSVSVKFQLKTAVEPETCFQCHKDRRAQLMRSSHMPLREGKMVCSDCHNPHGSATEGLLRADSINDTCYKCHAEKRGPMLFEHLPVRENCLNCHDPHGSVNEYLLKVSRPRLCAECHTFGHGLNSGMNAVQSVGRQCQNCHTQVHGSNSPAGALLQR
jgi:DmsE family decaheme c-type cytochrome